MDGASGHQRACPPRRLRPPTNGSELFSRGWRAYRGICRDQSASGTGTSDCCIFPHNRWCSERWAGGLLRDAKRTKYARDRQSANQMSIRLPAIPAEDRRILPQGAEHTSNAAVETAVVSVQLRWFSVALFDFRATPYLIPKMQKPLISQGLILVGARGFEPPTPSLPGVQQAVAASLTIVSKPC